MQLSGSDIVIGKKVSFNLGPLSIILVKCYTFMRTQLWF